MDEALTDTSLQNLLRLNTEGNEQTSHSISITNRNRNIFLLKNYTKMNTNWKIKLSEIVSGKW